MKLNKKILKSIVKECLVEILAEGLVQGTGKPIEKRVALQESVRSASRTIDKRPIARESNKHRSPDNNLQTRGSYLDQVSFNGSQQVQNQEPTPEINQRTRSMVSKVTSVSTDGSNGPALYTDPPSSESKAKNSRGSPIFEFE